MVIVGSFLYYDFTRPNMKQSTKFVLLLLTDCIMPIKPSFKIYVSFSDFEDRWQHKKRNHWKYYNSCVSVLYDCLLKFVHLSNNFEMICKIFIYFKFYIDNFCLCK